MREEEAEGRAAIYELAFEEAGRGLDAQERSVSELRGRAGVLIASAAVTTSFFGSRAISGVALTLPAWLAVAAFVGLGATVLVVLWPRSDWSFNADASDIIADYAEPSTVPLPTVHRDLALHRATSYSANAKQLGDLFLAFRIGLVLLVLEVAAWLVAVAQRD